MLAFGRRDATGHLQAAVARIVPATGAPRATPILGAMGAETDAQPPDVADLALSADGSKLAVISRPAVFTAAAVTVDLFAATPALVTSLRPAALASAQTAAIGWSGTAGAGRFVAASVTAQGPTGGVDVALDDATLMASAPLVFTAAGDAPVVGSAGATTAVAGMGDLTAIVWTDAQSCADCSGREIFLTVVDAAGNRPYGQVQVSAPSNVGKSFPHVVFDGQALAVAWLEFTSATSSSAKLRRFDRSLAPLGAPLDVAPPGSPRPVLGDLGLTVGTGPGDYGVTMLLFTGKQSFTRVTCTAN